MNKSWKEMRDDYLAQVRSAECKERERRMEEGRRKLEKLMQDMHAETQTAKCPCCNGSGRMNIAAGAKDDQ